MNTLPTQISVSLHIQGCTFTLKKIVNSSCFKASMAVNYPQKKRKEKWEKKEKMSCHLTPWRNIVILL